MNSEEPQTVNFENSVTATEAAEIMQISPRKLAQLLAEGKLRWYPDARHKQIKRILRADIDAWMRQAGPPRPRRRLPEEVEDARERPAA